jgi:hypothetical protein
MVINVHLLLFHIWITKSMKSSEMRISWPAFSICLRIIPSGVMVFDVINTETQLITKAGHIPSSACPCKYLQGGKIIEFIELSGSPWMSNTSGYTWYCDIMWLILLVTFCWLIVGNVSNTAACQLLVCYWRQLVRYVCNDYPIGGLYVSVGYIWQLHFLHKIGFVDLYCGSLVSLWVDMWCQNILLKLTECQSIFSPSQGL